jgi:hypothetical protein
VLDGGPGNKQRKFAALHEISQQKGVFSPECNGIEQTRFNVHAGPSNGKPGSIQVSNATIWLEHVFLKSSEP